MSRIIGIGKVLQIGEETEYGVLPVMDMVVNYTSESLKQTSVKEPEKNPLADKTVDTINLKGYKVSGDIGISLKPENLPIFKYLLHEPSAPTLVVTGVYKHTLTLIPANVDQSSFAATIDRGADVFAYTGLVVESASISGAAQSPVELTLSVRGYAEVPGTLATLTNPSKDTFNTTTGVVTIKGSEIDDVTSASLDINNGLDDGAPTYGSGLYDNKPGHGRKVVTVNTDVFYNTTTNDIREADYKNNTYIPQVITWESPAEIVEGHKYKIVFTLPKVSISEADPTISGEEVVKMSIVGTATGNAGAEPLTVEIYDSIATKY